MGTWNFRNFTSNRNFCWIQSSPGLTASSLLFHSTSSYFDTRRSKPIITRNFAIDFYRFPMLVSWLVSNSIDNDSLLSTFKIKYPSTAVASLHLFRFVVWFISFEFDLVRLKFVPFRQSMRHTTLFSYNQFNAVQNLTEQLPLTMLGYESLIEHGILSKSLVRSELIHLTTIQVVPVSLVTLSKWQKRLKRNILTVNKLISSKRISRTVRIYVLFVWRRFLSQNIGPFCYVEPIYKLYWCVK